MDVQHIWTLHQKEPSHLPCPDTHPLIPLQHLTPTNLFTFLLNSFFILVHSDWTITLLFFSYLFPPRLFVTSPPLNLQTNQTQNPLLNMILPFLMLCANILRAPRASEPGSCFLPKHYTLYPELTPSEKWWLDSPSPILAFHTELYIVYSTKETCFESSQCLPMSARTELGHEVGRFSTSVNILRRVYL